MNTIMAYDDVIEQLLVLLVATSIKYILILVASSWKNLMCP